MSMKDSYKSEIVFEPTFIKVNSFMTGAVII